MKLDHITMNPARMNGQPCVRNLRLTVRRVVVTLDTDFHTLCENKGNTEAHHEKTSTPRPMAGYGPAHKASRDHAG